jgi:hypothetical protein
MGTDGDGDYTAEPPHELEDCISDIVSWADGPKIMFLNATRMKST